MSSPRPPRTRCLGPRPRDDPYLTAQDLTTFHRQTSTCIVVLAEGEIVASSWVTPSDVWVHELQRRVVVPPVQHFSCRSYVDERYRGRSLLSHMIHRYTASVDADDVIWGLVYDWNVASSRSLERIGWTRSGSEWSSYVLGRQRAGSSSDV